MEKKWMSLRWSGSFIELCMGCITPDQKKRINESCPDLNRDFQSLWYDNATLLKKYFNADNWWSVDDLDHAMGLIFKDRSALDAGLAALTVEIDHTPVTIDPESLQLSFYAPESEPVEGRCELVIRHGTRQAASLQLKTEFEPPFNPSSFTLSFIHYPDIGFVLIDLDYDGADEVQYSFGEKTYLKPRIFGKEYINGTSG